MDTEEQKTCFYCKDDFINLSLNKHSTDINKYVKHLGFCNIGCYDDYNFHHHELLRKLKRDKLIFSLQKYNSNKSKN